MKNGIQTQATITQLKVEAPASAEKTNEAKAQAANNTRYLIAYSYQDNNAKSHQSSRYSNKSYFEQKEIGQKLTLRYLPRASRNV